MLVRYVVNITIVPSIIVTLVVILLVLVPRMDQQTSAVERFMLLFEGRSVKLVSSQSEVIRHWAGKGEIHLVVAIFLGAPLSLAVA